MFNSGQTLSHSSNDKPFALKLAKSLTSIGIDVFLDSWELEVGDSLHKSLHIALSKSRFVGVLVSPNFAASEWCLNELSEVQAQEKLEQTKKIIPIVFDSQTVLPFLSDRLYVDCRKDFYVGIVKIAQVIHKISQVCLDSELRRKKPRSLRDVAKILGNCGCSYNTLLDKPEFERMKRDLEFNRINFNLTDDAGAPIINLHRAALTTALDRAGMKDLYRLLADSWDIDVPDRKKGGSRRKK